MAPGLGEGFRDEDLEDVGSVRRRYTPLKTWETG